MTSQVDITSFILRFTREMNGAPWRVYARHIQTNTEQNFASLSEVVGFMQSYLDGLPAEHKSKTNARGTATAKRSPKNRSNSTRKGTSKPRPLKRPKRPAR